MTKDVDTAVRGDVAVVLCTYNGARHVGEQLTSVLRQSILPGEIRVYDDRSNDDTLEVLLAVWERRDDRATEVRLHVAPAAPSPFGAAQNFARAILDSPQAIIALCDQDDEWMPDRLEAALELLDADPAVELVASDAVMTDAAGVPVGRTVFEAQRLTRSERAQFDRGDYLPALVRRNLAPGMTLTLRRSLMATLGPLPDGAMHDYWLVAAAAARNTLRIVPRPLVRYRIHGGNAVGLDTGTRSLATRVRLKLRSFRAPLTDLPQWVDLPERLTSVGDAAAAARLVGKRQFELDRRHTSRSRIARARSAVELLRGDAYATYEFQGRTMGLRDAIRRRDPHLASLRR